MTDFWTYTHGSISGIVALIALNGLVLFGTASLHRETLSIPDQYLPKIFGSPSTFEGFWIEWNTIVTGITLICCESIAALIALVTLTTITLPEWTIPWIAAVEFIGVGGSLGAVLSLCCASSVTMIARTLLVRRQFNTESKLIPAVIALRSGRRLRGCLYNTEFLERDVHARLLASDGQVHLIAAQAISTVFIGPHRPQDERFRPDRFIVPPSVFKLRRNGGETFPAAPSYRTRNFRVFPSSKPDSSTRFVVATEIENEV